MGHPTEDRDMFQKHHGKNVLALAPGLPSLEIIPFRVAAYHTGKKQMDFFDETKASDFMFISGTKVGGGACILLCARARSQPRLPRLLQAMHPLCSR